MVCLQDKPIDVAALLADFSVGLADNGAEVSFVGRMRALSDARDAQGRQRPLEAMTLEHYPRMAQKQMRALQNKAHGLWTLEKSLLVHRYGRILPREVIVLVAVASNHRAEAFAACCAMMDWLKVEAPFWKYEHFVGGGGRWVGTRKSDKQRALSW
ncbi:MAG: molybdenum cofactor biosynthesis protein MoaE [Alphaproteobacteria bacterium GM202ARS2]|nr:molybdenum cofactor biosynthesis protein MoaE [Alphaproteobacteria bacterium GM202ARS2]